MSLSARIKKLESRLGPPRSSLPPFPPYIDVVFVDPGYADKPGVQDRARVDGADKIFTRGQDESFADFEKRVHDSHLVTPPEVLIVSFWLEDPEPDSPATEQHDGNGGAAPATH